MRFWIIVLVSLAACSVGFHMYICFFSVGYGLSVAVIGAALLIGFRRVLSPGTAAACVLFIIYGLRLSGYLLIRELKSANYRKVLNPEIDRSRKMPVIAKISLWIVCGLLFALMTCPVFFRLVNGAADNPTLWIGIVFMVCGIVLETIADKQKSEAKRKNSKRFVDSGLYRFVRCPNYLGELVLWLGVLLTGAAALKGFWQWFAAILGFVLIVWVMFSGARRLELRQDRNYGSDPDYQEYVKTVPILLPFIPLYSVKKYTFLIA